MLLHCVLLFIGAMPLASAFVPTPKALRAAAAPTPFLRRTMVAEAVSAIDPAAVDEARTAFFFWLFGASGGAGIARSAFPRMYNNVQEVNALKDVGPTKRGETIDISPLCGYPRAIYKADVEQVLSKKITVEQIVEKYPIEGNFLSAGGYLTYQAFTLANKDANPLTLRVIFDSLNTSSDVCSPDIAQERLDAYRNDINALATNVLFAKLRGYIAIFGLLFLLALADYEAFVVHFRTGKFVVVTADSDKSARTTDTVRCCQ
jgi:hypothetical protein